MATSAQAVTVMVDGDSIAIGSGFDTEFIGNVVAGGGAGSWAVDFLSNEAAFGNAQATITNLVAGTFSGLTMEWVNSDTAGVISSSTITPIITNLGTTFIDPDSLNQTLRISWTDSLNGAGFGAEVVFSPVPIPAAVWLFGSGLLGLVGMARRKKA